nr:uncharacterized protein LOC121127675 [Lepeophtheirus salmonis]
MVDKDGRRVEWKYLQELGKLQTSEGQLTANKLKKKHINFRNKKMKDHIELFLCAIRFHLGSNNNPTYPMFSSIYKQLLVRHHIFDSGGNCTGMIFTTSKNKRKPLEVFRNLDDKDLSLIKKYCLDVPPFVPNLYQFKECGVAYIGGYVIKSVSKH